MLNMIQENTIKGEKGFNIKGWQLQKDASRLDYQIIT